MLCYQLKRGFYKCILVSMVMLHVIIALTSLFLATYSLFKPSRRLMVADWSLIVATIVSGVVLIAIEPSRMLHACVAGLCYVVIASALTLAANVRYKEVLRKKKIIL